jgi:hypothetical protein
MAVRWGVVAVVAIGLSEPVSAQSLDGQYVGTGSGHTIGPGIDADVTVHGGKITGEARRTVVTNHIVKPETSSLRGDVSSDGTVTMRMWNRSFPGTLGNGELSATYTGNECEYQFTLRRAG